MKARSDISGAIVEELVNFARKSDKGEALGLLEWPEPDNRRACSVLVPNEPVERWLITTKMVWIENVYADEAPTSPRGIIGLGSLPTRGQLRLVKQLVSSATGPARFVGDLDPIDLMVFLVIKVSTPKTELAWAGVGDEWFRVMGLDLSSASAKSSRFPMTRFEQKLLRRMISEGVDIDALVGPSASIVLRAGEKIELEGASSREILGASVAKLRLLLD